MEPKSENMIRKELNFLQYPYFALSTKGLKNKQRTEVRRVIETDNGDKLETYWLVNAHPDYGYPGPFDRLINMAVEYIVSQMPLPIANPIRLGSWYEFCQLMRVPTTGRNYRQIRQGIIRMITTTIESKHSFYHKGKKKWINDVFHLYDHLVEKGDELDGSDIIADTNYLYLNSWYIDNLNAKYFKYLDYDYCRSLAPFASKLYKIFGLKFFGIKDVPADQRFIRYKYSTVCIHLLQATRQKYKSDAQKQLYPAHNQLLTTKFLSKVTWSPIPGVKNNWYIRYYPGKRFFNELDKFMSGTPLFPALVPDDTPIPQHQPMPPVPADDTTPIPDNSPDNSEEPISHLPEPVQQEIVQQEQGMLFHRQNESPRNATEKGPTNSKAVKSKCSSDYNKDFLAFWDAYPVKVGKRYSFKCWKRLGSNLPPLAILLDAIRDQKKNNPRWLSGYIPNPSTFLNQGRWEDLSQSVPEPIQHRSPMDDWAENDPANEPLVIPEQCVRAFSPKGTASVSNSGNSGCQTHSTFQDVMSELKSTLLVSRRT